MTANDDTTPIDGLSPEIIQAVWSHLPFRDLLCCQRVCKKWNAYLPGNDPALCKILFSPDIRETVSKVPFVTIWINVTQHLELSQDHLPRTKFRISLETVGVFWCRGDSLCHPIVKTLEEFNDLVDPSFKRGFQPPVYEFYDYDDLKVLAKNSTSNGESWEQMLACVPKVQELDIDVQ